MIFELSAEERTRLGSPASKKFRQSGAVPGIVYGAGEKNDHILLNHIELAKHMRHQSFYASLITLVIGKKKQTVLLKDYQLHPFKAQIYHIDFKRVNENEDLIVSVPLEFINAETCDGVKIDGGMVNYVMNSLEVQCLPKYLPSKLVVDLQSLRSSHSIVASNIILPKNVKAVCLNKGEDLPIATIVTNAPSEDTATPTAEKTPTPVVPAKNTKNTPKK